MGKLVIALCTAILSILGISSAAGAEANPVQPLKNSSFEKGLNGWSLEYSKQTYPDSAPATVVDAPGHPGRKALLIESANVRSSIFAGYQVQGLPSGRYEASCLVRPEFPERSANLLLTANRHTRNFLEGDLTVFSSIIANEAAGNGWIRRAIRFSVPAGKDSIRLGFSVVDYCGKVWFDSLELKRVPESPLPIDGLWHNDVSWLDDGIKTRERFYALQDANSPFIERAKLYNKALFDLAFARDGLATLRRARLYAPGDSEKSLVSRLRKLFVRTDEAERLQQLFTRADEANRLFARIYMARDEKMLADQFDPLMKPVADESVKLRADVDKVIAGVVAWRSKQGTWTPPPFGAFIERNEATQSFLDFVDRAAPKFASSSNDQLELWPLVDGKGQYYLGVLNRNSDLDTRSTLKLRGKFSRVTDMDIPGGLPVPVITDDSGSRAEILLGPAAMTLLKLEP